MTQSPGDLTATQIDDDHESHLKAVIDRESGHLSQKSLSITARDAVKSIQNQVSNPNNRCTKWTLTLILVSIQACAIILSFILITENIISTTNGASLIMFSLTYSYFILLIDLIIFSTNIHRMRIRRSIIKHFFTEISLPTKVIEDKTRPIYSMFEISAIPGSLAHKMLLVTNTSISVIIGMVCLGNLETFDILQRVFVALVIIGLMLLGTYELDYNSTKFYDICQYLGLVCIVSGCFGFVFETDYALFAIVVTSIACTLIFIWLMITIMVPKKSNDVKVVHYVSLYCIFTEITAVFVVYNAICLWIWFV